MIIRTDQENPIEAFRCAVTRAREGETIVEGAVKGMIVTCKGVTGDSGAIRDVVDTIDKGWGRGRIIIRTDQENPIEAFRSAVVRAREGVTVVELSLIHI